MQNQTTNQNGTPRRNIFAGFMSMPAVAVAASAAPPSAATRGRAGQPSKWMPDVLRQAEMNSVLDDVKAIQVKILGYRRRIRRARVWSPVR